MINKAIFWMFLVIPIIVQGKTVPENDWWIGVDEKSNGMTKEKFNEIISKVEKIYKPIVEVKRKRLKIYRKWDDGTVNAYAQKTFKTLKVFMFGGMARHKESTFDSFALVVCHELGHHIGGIPQKAVLFSKMSNEGQADYWGAMKCLRKYMEKDDNANIVAEMEIPSFLKTECEETHKDLNEVGICMRISMAGVALGRVFNTLKKKPLDVLNIETPSKKVVKRTDNKHPASQCRIDTYFAAAICEKNAYEDVSNRDANQGVCSRKDGDIRGVRPLCWYKPPNS
jgi:hypothetical protein